MDELKTEATPAAPAAATPGLKSWIVEGLRAAVCLRPRLAGEPAPWHFAVLVIASTALSIGLGRLEVPGPAAFNPYAVLASWWSAGALLLLLWAVLWRHPRSEAAPGGVASWFALWLVALLPLVVVSQGLSAAQERELLPKAVADAGVFQWGAFIVFWGWMLAVAIGLGRRYGLKAPRLAGLAIGLIAIESVLVAYPPGASWYSDAPYDEEARPRLSLSQETFEQQQEVWQRSVRGIAPQRPGVRDVYGVVFAPYASEDVFLRESTMVADVLAQRFDAQGRVLQLVNHATTAEHLPWATPLNLRRAIEAVAQRMDREQDLLVVYLTSHGGRNFQLAASHWPLKVETLSPAELRTMLDEAGIRHRVIAVSACYSGGWVGPLASETSLVMTAADADHTSYGCGRRSELTFFGRALFDEQLRRTHSFEQAFAAAVPLIRQREVDAKKQDGFSNPQISVGDRIRPVLADIARRLDTLPTP